MNADDKLQQYLWDPSAPPAPEAESIERRLAPLRFDPAREPLDMTRLIVTTRPRPAWRRPLLAFAIAAVLIIVTAAGLWSWRWRWPNGRPWTIAAGAVDLKLQVGQPVTVRADDAIANIARIGTMRIGAGTSMELRSTRGIHHRLRMTGGEVHVRVWAPPGSVVIETPAGEVIDFGCEFRLSVRGVETRVQVLSGWVQLENGIEEILVPAGAATEMTDRHAPGVPVFDDAPRGYREDIRSFEREGHQEALTRALAVSRPRDVYTLLHLAEDHPDHAEAILRRAAELSPPPGGITIASILRGNRDNLFAWIHAQPLPPPKSSWLRNWRDALPFWLSER